MTDNLEMRSTILQHNTDVPEEHPDSVSQPPVAVPSKYPIVTESMSYWIKALKVLMTMQVMAWYHSPYYVRTKVLQFIPDPLSNNADGC